MLCRESGPGATRREIHLLIIIYTSTDTHAAESIIIYLSEKINASRSMDKRYLNVCLFECIIDDISQWHSRDNCVRGAIFSSRTWDNFALGNCSVDVFDFRYYTIDYHCALHTEKYINTICFKYFASLCIRKSLLQIQLKRQIYARYILNSVAKFRVSIKNIKLK